MEAEAERLPCLKAGNRFLFEPNTVVNILIERAKKMGQTDTLGRADE